MRVTKIAGRSIRGLAEASADITRWLTWELESLEDFHRYAQLFGGKPGGNVYTFVLEDALRSQGLTLAQFRDGK
jgi:hypothetical protein